MSEITASDGEIIQCITIEMSSFNAQFIKNWKHIYVLCVLVSENSQEKDQRLFSTNNSDNEDESMRTNNGE